MTQGIFRYLEWQDLYRTEKPFQILIDLPQDAQDQRRTNVSFHDGAEQEIQDVRGHADQANIDTHGFAYVAHETRLQASDFQSKDMVEKVYLPECESLLREALDGVGRVYFYNWLLRDSSTSPETGKTVDFGDPHSRFGPARVVHIDQTSVSAVERVHLELPSEADDLLRGRLRLINLWRPINGPLESWPLALRNGRCVSEASLVESDRVRRKYTGGTTFVLEEPGRKWYYMSDQQDNEVAVFKNFDSDRTVTGYAPHTSFMLPSQSVDSRPRQSIEVRAMVFTNPIIEE